MLTLGFSLIILGFSLILIAEGLMACKQKPTKKPDIIAYAKERLKVEPSFAIHGCCHDCWTRARDSELICGAAYRKKKDGVSIYIGQSSYEVNALIMKDRKDQK